MRKFSSNQFGLAIVAAVAMANMASAAIIPVANGNFEATSEYSFSAAAQTTTLVTGWSSTTGNNSDNSWGAQRPFVSGSPSGAGASGTDTYAYFWRTGNNQIIYQNLGEALVADTTYTVNGFVRAVDGTTAGSLRLYSFGSSTGGTLSSGSGGELASSAVVSNTASNPWTPVSVSFTPAVSGGFLGVGLFRNSGNTETNLFFDEITASSQAIPEPTSIAALAIISGMILRRRQQA